MSRLSSLDGPNFKYADKSAVMYSLRYLASLHLLNTFHLLLLNVTMWLKGINIKRQLLDRLVSILFDD